MANEFKYQVRIITPKSVAEQDKTKDTDVQLEDMVFATPLIEKQSLWVSLPKSYSQSNFEKHPNNRLLLGIIQNIYADAEFAGKKAATYLLIRRNTPDQRFDTFVVDYQSQVSNRRSSDLKRC
ncbi:MAG: hypothetical protein U9R34_02995 [Nanoarchaeota archaeon]|nr:hypothetical protein [Nanoarchaeota archaeon]